MIYISAGHSISAGIITEGSIFRGAGDAAGEIGHTKCTDSDERCTCGSTGCLELYASVPMINVPDALLIPKSDLHQT
jgi:predicted NBD/HSP70 family sugar kinase